MSKKWRMGHVGKTDKHEDLRRARALAQQRDPYRYEEQVAYYRALLRRGKKP